MSVFEMVNEFAERHGVAVTVTTYLNYSTEWKNNLKNEVRVYVDRGLSQGGWQSRAIGIPHLGDPTDAVRELLEEWLGERPDEFVSCPGCGGEGGGSSDSVGPDFEHTTKTYECQECGGEGSIERWKAERWGSERYA